MINLETISPTAREAGVVYTKPWMVELVLDLAGYVPDRPLTELVEGYKSRLTSIASKSKGSRLSTK